MRNLFRILLIILLPAVFTKKTVAQEYVVNRVPFSSGLNDEFSPVFYKGGIVFCSNMRDNSVISYTDTENRIFRLFYADGNDSAGWEKPSLLSKELVSGFNDGPGTITNNGNTIYFSRNNYTVSRFRNSLDTSNRLGIFRADVISGVWRNIEPFKYNDPLYSFTTPSVTPDGTRIYFSSDIPGGAGGMDLYYCESDDQGWSKPVNLGPLINTPGNETFPFAAAYNKLYFSSDGHGGYGKKDIFYSTEINGEWSKPVHMDTLINSPEDDFGIVIDSSFTSGYFSSRRMGTDDIFSFRASPVEFSDCDTIKNDNFCFTFYDELHHSIDTIPAVYTWDFGNGIHRHGVEVKQCFPGPGKYSVRLIITDRVTGDTITRGVVYEFELQKSEQAFISSPFAGLKDRTVSFDAEEINLKSFNVTDYLWNFGNGFRQGNRVVSEKFTKAGRYYVRLGLLGEKDSLGRYQKKCFMKDFRIYNSFREMEQESLSSVIKAGQGVRNPEIRFLFMDDISDRQRNRIKSMLEPVNSFNISFDDKGIISESYSSLDRLVEILKQNPALRIDISVYATGESQYEYLPQLWANEVSYYFRERNLNLDSHFNNWLPFSSGTQRKDVYNEGIIEIMFMEN